VRKASLTEPTVLTFDF